MGLRWARDRQPLPAFQQLRMSWALTGARARWHRDLEVERHSHRKAEEELFVLGCDLALEVLLVP